MKKIITTFAFCVALLLHTNAQNTKACPCQQPSPEAKLISSTHEDGATITRWMVPSGSGCMNNQYYIQYRMNLATLSPSFADNSSELDKLSSFIASVDNDQLKKIRSIDITGYASPDGVKSQNEKLAQQRAMSLRKYVTNRCNIEGCGGETIGVALPWSDIDKQLKSSNLPSKQSILNIVNSNSRQAAIEINLRQSDGWDYIKSSILPQMRYVDVSINYDTFREVVTRTPDVAVSVVDIERVDGATVALVDEAVIADSPYDNKPPRIVEEDSFIMVINHRPRSSAEFIATDYLMLDY